MPAPATEINIKPESDICPGDSVSKLVAHPFSFPLAIGLTPPRQTLVGRNGENIEEVGYPPFYRRIAVAFVDGQFIRFVRVV